MPPRLAVPVMFRLVRSAVLPSTVLLKTVRLLLEPFTALETLTVLPPAFRVTSAVVRFRAPP